MLVENIFNISKNIQIYTAHPKREFNRFKKHFFIIKAAGGIVEYQNKYLFIKRLGKWDLPKGKIETDEKPRHAAIREIQEECNISGHAIEKKLCNTYHTYTLDDQQILKKTFWYHLSVQALDLETLQPQTDEGITDLRWFSIAEFDEVRANTFDSIQVVLDTFLKESNF